MCTCNGEKYLAEQMESIIHQTYPISEIIIQDDGSTDGTMEILRNYEQKHAHIHLFQNKTRKGVNQNFFSVIARATSDYVAISDQDDIWELNKLEQQMNTIGDNWLSCHYSRPFLKKNGDIHSDFQLPNLFLERLVYCGFLGGHSFVIKKNIIDLAPHNTMYVWYDQLLLMTAVTCNKVSFLEMALVNFRRHVDAATYISSLRNYDRTIKNLGYYFARTWKSYIELREPMRSYFLEIYQFLESLPVQNPSKTIAQKMALHQSQKGWIAYLKLAVLCVKSRNRIFSKKEKNPVFAIIRAIYFPISCSDYFLFFLKKK